jgi:hypothetical protein
MAVSGYGDRNAKMAKKVVNGNVWLNWRDMRMNVNVLHGVVMDDTSLLVREIKVYGSGKVNSPKLPLIICILL